MRRSCLGGIAPIIHNRSGCAPVLLEFYETRIVGSGTPHIQFLNSAHLRILNCLPKQQRCPAKITELVITASVFVNHGFLVRESDDARDWRLAFEGDSNPKVLAHTRDHGAEPFQRLGRKTLTPSSNDEQPVKMI